MTPLSFTLEARRFRRYRKTRRRPIRFRHRTGHKTPPSIKANRELEWRVLNELAQIYPITHVVYEVVRKNRLGGDGKRPSFGSR